MVFVRGQAAMLLADASAVFVPVIGMVGGIAAMALANHERLKLRIRLELRIEALETRLAQAEMARRGQPRRANSVSEITNSTVPSNMSSRTGPAE
jgi:hypothetical protein